MKRYEEDTALADVRLVASDMDCTLLADDGSMPPGMHERIRALAGAGVTFAAASGRPLYTLRDLFEGVDEEMAFVSDNGAAVMCRGEVVFKSLVDPAVLAELTAFSQGIAGVVPVVCGLDAAYVPACGREHDQTLRPFYHNIVYVDSLDGLGVEANKFTLLLPAGNSARVFDEAFSPRFGGRLSVTCAGATWIDVMNFGVDKGTGVARLCEHLGVSLADAAAFGDTDNDAEMLEAVGHSFLVANAERRMERHARFRAPSNNDRGVAVVADRILQARLR